MDAPGITPPRGARRRIPRDGASTIRHNDCNELLTSKVDI